MFGYQNFRANKTTIHVEMNLDKIYILVIDVNRVSTNSVCAECLFWYDENTFPFVDQMQFDAFQKKQMRDMSAYKRC